MSRTSSSSSSLCTQPFTASPTRTSYITWSTLRVHGSLLFIPPPPAFPSVEYLKCCMVRMGRVISRRGLEGDKAHFIARLFETNCLGEKASSSMGRADGPFGASGAHAAKAVCQSKYTRPLDRHLILRRTHHLYDILLIHGIGARDGNSQHSTAPQGRVVIQLGGAGLNFIGNIAHALTDGYERDTGQDRIYLYDSTIDNRSYRGAFNY